MKEVKPSKRAFAAVQKMARDAAKEDGWMTPCLEEHTAKEKDIGNAIQAHREGWQGTEHFAHFYGRTIKDIADRQSDRFKGCTSEERIHLYYDLIEAFWDEWETRVDIYNLQS